LAHSQQAEPVNAQSTVVLNEAQFSKPVHEKTDSCSGCANHFRQDLLTYFRNQAVGVAILSKISKQQKRSGQPPFTGAEHLVREVIVDLRYVSQQISNQRFREPVLLVDGTSDLVSLHLEQCASRNRSGRAQAPRLDWCYAALS
jgi:hypothetical protein